MKKTSKFSLFVMVLSAVILSSCSKYEEGPNFSLASKESRMSREWKLESTTMGGSTVTCTNCWNFNLSASAVSSTNSAYANLSWQFSDDKEKLQFVASAGASTGSSSANVSVTYSFTILRLSSKELWIKDDLTGVELHLIAA